MDCLKSECYGGRGSRRENLLAIRDVSLEEDEDRTLKQDDEIDNIFEIFAKETEEAGKEENVTRLEDDTASKSPTCSSLSPVNSRREPVVKTEPICKHKMSLVSKKSIEAKRENCTEEDSEEDRTLDKENSSIFDRIFTRLKSDDCYEGYGNLSTSNVSLREISTPPPLSQRPLITNNVPVVSNPNKPINTPRDPHVFRKSREDTQLTSGNQLDSSLNSKFTKMPKKYDVESPNIRTDQYSNSSRRYPVPKKSRIATYAKREPFQENDDQTLREANDSIFERVAKEHENAYRRQRAEQIFGSNGRYESRSTVQPAMPLSRRRAKTIQQGCDENLLNHANLQWLPQLISSMTQVILCVIVFLFIGACLTKLGLGGAMLLVRSLGASLLQVFFGFFTFIMLVVSRLGTETRFLVNLFVCDFKDQACLRMDVFCDHTCLWLDSWKDWIDDISHHKQEYW